MLHKVTDWNDAYANGANIAGGDRWPGLWATAASRFIETVGARARLDLRYGSRTRNRFDLFMPEGTPRGLVVFVHGGFWRMLDKSFGSHLAAGPLAHRYAVAMPSYTLTPEVRVAEIGREIATAIESASALVEGPIRLVGHSAGGQLVTRMMATSSPLAPAVSARVQHVVSLAGLHDLRPLVNMAANIDMRIDEAEADAESPALLRPLPHTRLTCWVGQAERAEFVRQSQLLANIWKGLGVETGFYAEPDKHHFTIVDGLADPNHPLVRTLLS